VFHVAAVNALDGTKVVLDTGWWFGVRASGTEPVARPYVETFAPPGADPRREAEAREWQRRIMAWLSDEVARVIA
jgi:phosphomannomutase